MGGQEVTFFAAFAAGLLSFVSPCVLPLIPAYLSYITGMSIEEYSGELKGPARRKVIVNTLFFILGFAFIFIVVFGAGTSLLGAALKHHKALIGQIGGAVIFVFGLHFMGVFRIKWLYREKRVHFKRMPGGYLGSFLLGIAFSAGWTPCVGPILGSIAIKGLAAESQWEAISLLSFYTLGLALPFFFTSLAINFALALFNRIKHHFRAVEIATGLLLILVGVLMFAGVFETVSGGFLEYLHIV